MAVVIALLAAVLVTPPAAASTTPGCTGTPVLLVHDFAATAASMRPLERRLAATGRCVQTRTYGTLPTSPIGGMQSLEVSARQLAGWIRTAGAQRRVDVVAHGAGSLAVVRALQLARQAGSPLPVRTSIALGGVWSGTNLAFLGDLDLLSRQAGSYEVGLAVEKLLLDPFCASCREVIAHSDFLTELTTDGVVVPGVRQVNVVTRYDELVVPYRSGTHPGMTNVVLQQVAPPALVEHLGLPSSAAVARVVESYLGR